MRSDPLVSMRYDLRTIWFHWAVAILVLIQWGIAQGDVPLDVEKREAGVAD